MSNEIKQINVNNFNSETVKKQYFKKPMIARRLVAKPAFYHCTLFVDNNGNLKESHIEKKKGDLLLLQITAHLPNGEDAEGNTIFKDLENKQALCADLELLEEIVPRAKEGLPCFIQVTAGKGGFYTQFVSKFEMETWLEMMDDDDDETEETDDVDSQSNESKAEPAEKTS